MKDLYERLAALTAPDRDVADDVLRAFGWAVIEFSDVEGEPWRYRWQAPDSKIYLHKNLPDPTEPLARRAAALLAMAEKEREG